MKETIYTKDAPQPVGPYSQAILHNDTVYISGQIAIDPETNELVSGGIEEQTEKVLQNIKIILLAADSSLGSVLKTTCYLADINDFAKFNEVYGKYFSKSRPARSIVEVSRLPKGALVEVDVVAYVD